MGTKYPGVSISGYNSSPPTDDGAQTANNKITWAGIKSKLADPINTLAAAIDTALQAAFSYGANTQATNYTTVAADHDKVIQVTAAATITALLAATGGAGYRFGVSNQHSAAITVARSGSDTFNGAATSFSVPAGTTAWFWVNAAGNGYLADGASNLGAATATSINFGGSTLSTYSESSFTGTFTGCTTAPTGTFKYTLIGNFVSLTGVPTTLTSNAVTKSVTGAPAAIQPVTQQRCYGVLAAQDNGGAFNLSTAYMETSGTINLYYQVDNAWTNVGTWTVRAWNMNYQKA